MSNTIVVVDTGIDLNNTYLNHRRIDGISIKRIDGKYKITTLAEDANCIQDYIGHGTAVCGIISSHNAQAELFVIKLFDWDVLHADEEMLCFALEYILHHVDCCAINLSLGVCAIENEKLYNVCCALKNKKKVIIAAFDNNGAISYPAAFDCVIGVTSGEMCINNDDVYVCNNRIVNVCAKGRQQRLRWLNNTLLMGYGNSYACAHLTGIVSKQLSGNSDDVNILLMNIAKGTVEIEDSTNEPHLLTSPVAQYKRVVAFPFNKEIHSLVRFQDLLPFELIDIYDIKYSARVGSSTDDILNIHGKRSFIIKNIADIDWDSFDTFILGHTFELSAIINQPQLVEELVKNLLIRGKRIYSFDDLTNLNISDEHKRLIYHPQITREDVPVCPFGKLYRQDKPVLGVFGTSSRQGKFTLQLVLRRELLNKGYMLAQIGTEPSSLLFGMNAVFPNGYNSAVYIHQKDTVAYLNNILYQLSRDADIIIVGGQSGIVIRDEGNLDNYNFSQIDFLYATQPDAVILCVNVFDDLDVVARTISFLEASVGCRVIALAVFPFQPENLNSSYHKVIRLENEDFIKYKKLYKNKFHIPAYLMNDAENIHALIDFTISYFTD